MLQIHSAYVREGGEDKVVLDEAGLLRSRDNAVAALHTSNADVVAGGSLSTVRALFSSAWNPDAYRRTRAAIREFRPDVVHVHNFWFVLSPSVLAAAKAEGIATVLTLHNFRLVCPGALLMRGRRVCETCVGSTPWRGVFRRCYRKSAALSALVARMIDSNRRRGTWTRDVDAYIALTNHGRRKFIQGGFPPGRIFVKPNFLARDPGEADGPGEGAVFVGRLSPEKGACALVRAWRDMSASLTVVGDGPERSRLEALAREVPGVEFTGALPPEAVAERLRRAGFLVMPSLCYETFGRTIIEAFACGRPVIASRLGAAAELVEDGRTGLLFEPGNVEDLAEKVRFMLDHPGELERMGRRARAEFARKYTAEANYPQLMAVYERAIGHNRLTSERRRRHVLKRYFPPARERPPTASLARSGVSVVTYESAIRYVETWAERGESRYVCVCPATGIVTAWLEPGFRRILNEADMVTPDGMPVVWTMRLMGEGIRRRVYGPDLMLHICRLCADRGWRIFLYGSTEETLTKLAANLRAKTPGLKIAGGISPPFRPVTEEEDGAITTRINASRARVVFVGLGMPKQERWMHEHRGRVRAVMLGVGAGFAFHAGTVRQAPAWMRERGLEWVFRLISEPGRLWRRYLRDVPLFGLLAMLQVSGALGSRRDARDSQGPSFR